MRYFSSLSESSQSNDSVQSILGELPWVNPFSCSSLILVYSSPQHPAAHGVLRLILELNGEEILRADPVSAPLDFWYMCIDFTRSISVFCTEELRS